MKNHFRTVVLGLALTGLISCSHHKYDVKMDVVVLNKKNEAGTYDQKLRIINRGDKPLGKDWKIYTTFHKRDMVIPENSPVKINHIDGTLHEIKPKEFFPIINPSDTLEIDYQMAAPFPGVSFVPDGAYMVFDDIKENNGKPLQLTTEVILEDSPEVAKNAGSYYASGDAVYNDNLNYMLNYDLQQSDIIPSVKSVYNLLDSIKLNKDIQVKISSDSLSNEQKYFQNSLASLGYVIGDAGTPITLVLDSSIDKVNGYKLFIEASDIVIKGHDATGVFYGMQTLLSMLIQQPVPATLKCMLIEDYPDLKYRGVMLDIARNYTSKKDILSLIDLLASYKMNKLHLHLTDDEGWRIEIPGIEELTEISSKRGVSEDETMIAPMYYAEWDVNSDNNTGTGYLTKEDFKDVLKYAQERHINVIPEVDLPGHSKAAIIAMNERYKKYKDTDPQKATEYLLYDPNDNGDYKSVQDYSQNTVNVAMPSTYAFTEKVIEEIAKMYDEAGVSLELFHIGGDEVPSRAWDGSEIAQEMIAAKDMKHSRELKDHFIREVLKYAKKNNIRIGGWQEMTLRSGDEGIDKDLKDSDIVTYCWYTVPSRGMDELPYKLANEEMDVILCNMNNLYMDLSYDKNFDEKGLMWGGYVDERSSFDVQPYDIYKSMRRQFNGRRMNADELAEAEKAAQSKTILKNKENIVGMQGQLWSETIRNYDDVTSYLFPKMLGLSERAWNTNISKSANHELKSYEEAVNLFNDKLSKKELNKLERMNVKYHVTAPGITIQNGKLLANSRLKGAEIRYTLDGSEPTAESPLWTGPVTLGGSEPMAAAALQAAPGKSNSFVVKAKAFFNGKESATSSYFPKN